MSDIVGILEECAAPLLEVLQLKEVGSDRLDHTTLYNNPIFSLFSGAASVPMLRSVHLCAVPLVWKSHPFKGLFHLELAHLTLGKILRQGP